MKWEELEDLGISGEKITPEELRDYQIKLQAEHIAVIPFEYENLLRHLNGLRTDCASLFGISSTQNIDDIYKNNTTSGIKRQREILYLGYNLSKYLSYSWPEKMYYLQDKKTLQITNAFLFLDQALIKLLSE